MFYMLYIFFLLLILSSVISEAESKNLINVLGPERYQQLIQNLRDSETLNDDNETEILVHQSREIWHANSQQGKANTVDGEFRLDTHRPTFELSVEQDTYEPVSNNNVKFMYPLQEIYAEAQNNRADDVFMNEDIDSDADICAFVYPVGKMFSECGSQKTYKPRIGSSSSVLSFHYNNDNTEESGLFTRASTKAVLTESTLKASEQLTRESLEMHNAYLNGTTSKGKDRVAQEEFQQNLTKMEDGLFTNVTSVVENVDDAAFSERINRLGIDFHFLQNDNSDIGLGNSRLDVVEEDDRSLISTESTRGLRIICKECQCQNKTYVMWCVQCGAVVKGIIPQPIEAEQGIHRDGDLSPMEARMDIKKGARDSSPISEAIESFNYKVEGSLAQNETHEEKGEVMLCSVGQFEEDINHFENKPPEELKTVNSTTSYDLKTTTINFKFNSICNSLNKSECGIEAETRNQHTGSHIEKVKHQSNFLRDSDEFVYCDMDKKPSALPSALRAELSIDVRGSLESEVKSSKAATNSDSDSEDNMKFEYINTDITPKLKPQEKAALLLDLGESTTSNEFRENQRKDSPEEENVPEDADDYNELSDAMHYKMPLAAVHMKDDVATETNHFVAEDDTLYRRGIVNYFKKIIEEDLLNIYIY